MFKMSSFGSLFNIRSANKELVRSLQKKKNKVFEIKIMFMVIKTITESKLIYHAQMNRATVCTATGYCCTKDQFLFSLLSFNSILHGSSFYSDPLIS